MGADDAEFIATLYGFAERLRVEFEQAAAQAGLTTQQAVIMTMLAEPSSMRGLAKQRHCDPSNITGLVDRLERKGWVERGPDPSDRRVRQVSLTASGRRKVTRFQEALLQVSSLAGLGVGERKRLLAAVPAISEGND